MEKLHDRFNHLVMTSVHDCQVSLGYCNDADALRDIIAEMDRRGFDHKTRRRHIERRIRQIERDNADKESL